MTSPEQQSTHFKLHPSIALALIAVFGTALLAGIHALTRDDIDLQQQRVMMEQLGQVLPPSEFNNELHTDRILITDSRFFPGDQQVDVFRARMDGKPVAVVMKLVARNGYNGDIGLLVGILSEGQLAGVRVTSHRETPGLGDDIETHRSDWILSFEGHSLDSPPVGRWAVRRDGGEFDQFTGATITPRAVVDAVRLALEYYRDHREFLFAQTSAAVVK